MAYAAVISLTHTIGRLVNSSHILPSPEIIESACEKMNSLRESLEILDYFTRRKSSSRKRMNALDGQIREDVSKFEDVLESHLLNQIISHSGTIDLQDLKHEIHSFTEMLKKMEENIEELHRHLQEEVEVEEEEGNDAVSSRIGSGRHKSKMVGLSDVYSHLKEKLTTPRPIFPIVSLTGMAGIGKTTLASEIFEDPDIVELFDCRAWVTVGRKYQLKEIPYSILVQVNPYSDLMLAEREKDIAGYLKESLKGKRYLIVLDDVWENEVLRYDYLTSFLPHNYNGCPVLLTTRLQHVAESATKDFLKLRLLNKEESWNLLREKVFGGELCFSQLEEAGKKIAENCEGLPLTIVTIAKLLSKAEMTPEYWSEVAKQKKHQLFIDTYDEISTVLYSSYEYLSQDMKMHCLSMGVFPRDYEIPKSKLFNLWAVEGFFEPYRSADSKVQTDSCLKWLISNNLVTLYKNSTFSPLIMDEGVKSCRVHSSMWHLLCREAWKNKFFHVLMNHVDSLADGIKSQRRLCIHNNILFAIKEVYNSIEENCASTTRSLLCFGPYHQYPVPICFGLRLLKVLDALTIRFYEFPIGVLKLVRLMYLALTCNGKLPASISKLCNLQFLIVRRHLSIKSCGAPLYLPMEIWDMKELKHLQIMGSDLQGLCGTLLPNLLTLLDVSVHSCTKAVFEMITNLKKLGIRIELEPNDDGKLFNCLNHISHLQRLESLKCVVVNPKFGSQFVPPPAPLSMFPPGLKKLTLSGLGYPWEEMSKIASLQNLKTLKLRSNAFRGLKWEIGKDQFLKLKFLLIEDIDLVELQVRRGSFGWLECLSIKHCYKLEKIHWELERFVEKIELIDCNPLGVTCAKQIKEANHVHSSWDDGKLKL